MCSEATMPVPARQRHDLIDLELAAEAAAQRKRLGITLRTLRRSTSHLSQQLLAEHLHVKQSHISDLERGVMLPTDAEIAAIEEILPAFKEARRALTRPPGQITTFPHPVEPPAVPSAIAGLAELARVQDVARAIGCSTYMVRTLVRSGQLESERLGRLVRVHRWSVAAFLDRGR
jgi:excisionase family DNA binding protein